MISLPRKLFHAIEAMLYIAYNGAAMPISSKEVAGKQKLPPRYLEQMMQRLVRAGVLRGIRGPKGGYLLARERRRITLGDICEVLNGEEDALAPTTPLGDKIILPVIDRIDGQVMDQLRTVTLADLCEQAEQGRIRKTSEERNDFNI